MKRIFYFAVMAAFMFTSCSKEESINITPSGEKAALDLVISFPAATKAADSNASAADTKVTDVTVFVFNDNGSFAGMNGGNVPVTFVPADFTINTATNTYTLVEGKRITTTAGPVKIYVGINLPAALKSMATENALKAEYAAGISVLADATNGITMLSAVKPATLKAQEAGSTPTLASNKVAVTVERLVSKVAARQATSTTGPFANGFTVAADQFSVGNIATHIYPVQRIENSVLVTPMKNSTAVGNLVALNASATSVTDAAFRSFYVSEHRPSINNLRREATYAVVRGAITFTGFAYVDAGVIKVDGTPTLPAAGGKIYMVRDNVAGNATYFCKDLSDASLVVGRLTNATIHEYIVATDGKVYCFYYIFLNKTETDALAVYRNQFFDISVGNVTGMGYPGDPVNPDKPATVIPDPDVPVIPTAAYLEVVVDVKEWDYKPINTTLE